MAVAGEVVSGAPAAGPGGVRSRGTARLSFKRRGAATVIDGLYQQGCARLRFPACDATGRREAVLINTAGGMTGGDRVDCAIAWGRGTAAAVTTQAAERIYRSAAGVAVVETVLRVDAGARAAWLPQETILFHGGAVARTVSAEVAEGGFLLACESLVVGRRAMGETVRAGTVRDSWRIRHGGRLVFADTLRLDGDIAATLARPSIANGAEAFATVIAVGEGAAERRDGLRDRVSGLPGLVAATARDAMLIVRILARDEAQMRAGLVAVIDHLQEANDSLPRVWTC